MHMAVRMCPGMSVRRLQGGNGRARHWRAMAVPMIAVMMVVVTVVAAVALLFPCLPKYPQRDAGDNVPGGELEVRF